MLRVGPATAKKFFRNLKNANLAGLAILQVLFFPLYLIILILKLINITKPFWKVLKNKKS